MFGLDNAGKTSIIYYLKDKIGDNSQLPSNSRFDPIFNYKGLNIVEIDIGDCCRGKTRMLMHLVSKNAKGIIFVIDSSYIIGLEDYFIEEFDYYISQDDLKNLPILILANKQDLDDALSPEKIIEKISIDKLKDKKWHIVGTSVKTKKGIEEGFDWMISILNQ